MMEKLVPNRECGECTACCINLRIEEASLKKHAGTPCSHLIEKKGCGIYGERPEVCRNWYCAWRFMAQLDSEWRPDKSNILLRFADDGLILEAIKEPHTVLTSELALGIIGGGIEDGLSVSISVRTKEGFCNSLVKLNDGLKSVIASRDGYRVRNAMLKAINIALSQKTDPVSPLEN